MSTLDATTLEIATQRIGREILERARRYRPTPLGRRWWEERLMAWTLGDEAVKARLFRLVDVLPMLAEGPALARHVREYFGEVLDRLPWMVRWPLRAALATEPTGILAGKVARRQALGQARRFIAGATVAEVRRAAERERRQGRRFTLDLLGEAVTSEAEADRYAQAYLQLLADLEPLVRTWPRLATLDEAPHGSLPRVNVSLKLSALDSQFDPIDPEGTTERVASRLRPLLRAAQKCAAFVNVDMESYRFKDLTLAIFKHVLSEAEFRATSDVGIVLQCYLRDTERDLAELAAWAEARGTPVWVRLVKGAYWDYETIHAAAERWPVPVWQRKWESDAAYERLTRFALERHRWLRTALGSHNIRSLAHGLAVTECLGLPIGSVELQMLYGMADDEQRALVELGYPLRVYMPFGELIPGMAYLVRRLLENSANESFLRASSVGLSPEVLLMNPLEVGKSEERHAKPQMEVAARSRFDPGFENEPLADFSLSEPRAAMRAAFDQVRAELGIVVRPRIAGAEFDSEERWTSVNPSQTDEHLGTIVAAGAEQVPVAVAAAKRALAGWWGIGAGRRAEYLRDVATTLRVRKFELAAWIVLEVGKGWREADADVCEAIDFCNYYATCAVELDTPRGADVPGEENRFLYLPRGVTAVIAPWNFPLAILTGMSAAALAAGNTVVLKPAEQSSIVATKLMEVFLQVGLPADVVQFLPGCGETVGKALVEHPDVALIAFTGSRQVGLAIHRRAAEVSATGIGSVKKVIAEMGGKNAIIIDDDADLDEAVVAVVRSAFGYQGQKCSACSRVIVVGSAYEAFVERLVEATRSLRIGPAEDPGYSLGPVIDAEARERILKYVELGQSEARELLAVDVGPLAERGYYVGPHIFVDVPPRGRLAQEEIFGPVLAVLRAECFDEAITLLNGTEYALTGGVFSRSPAHLERAKRELMVGNLYLNRAITGALVGRQPFGGFRMSGIGSKAGGPDYLMQFLLPRTITENTLRRGFAPKEQ